MEPSQSSPQPEPDENGLHHCPRCTDAVLDLDKHLGWCEEPTPDPVAEARRLIALDEQARMQACAAEIEQVLARHGMRLDVTPAQISIAPA
ncbi:hypothetical protein [Streptomyces enissocaesilis]|uniref:Uncharacterized protein n=1 Tax=Streptomyces enissocaesilis TaxID=332589 RepID=A0ABN3WZB9_9ACTN